MQSATREKEKKRHAELWQKHLFRPYLCDGTRDAYWVVRLFAATVAVLFVPRRADMWAHLSPFGATVWWVASPSVSAV